MDASLFEQITSALTVKSICSPLGPDIPAGSTGDDLMVMHCEADIDPISHPSRIMRSDGSVKGVVWYEDYAQLESDDGPLTVDEVMQPLEPSELITSSTTILDAVGIFGSKPNRVFYVIHGNDVIGVLFYGDLFKPLGRLAFLALALEIEDQALTLCRSSPISEGCWRSISDNRKGKAIELFKLRHEREPGLSAEAEGKNYILAARRPLSDISLLIGCTNLADKATMIWKQRLISAAKRADILGFFNNLKQIRDRCAHPGGDEELLPRERLAEFVNSAKRMRDSMRSSLQSLTGM